MGIAMIRKGIEKRLTVEVKNMILKIFTGLAATVMMCANVLALEAEYVGSFEGNLHTPTSISADGDMIAVLDPYVGNIVFYSPDGPVLRRVHLNGDAHSLTRTRGAVYVFCDRTRRVVAAYDYASDLQYDELGTESGLADPVDIAYDGSRLHVLDAGNSSIMVYDANGSAEKAMSLRDEKEEKLTYASGFVYDSRGQQYYVIDQTQSRICRYDSEGNYLGSLAAFGAGDGEITRAGEIALTRDARIMITDRYQGRIAVFETDGRYLGGFGDGQSGEIPLALPTGIDVDENNFVYVASSMGETISVYYLPLATDDVELVTVIDQYPEDGAELETFEFALEASVEAYGASEKVVGFEFQLIEEGSDSPVEQSPVMGPEIIRDLGDNRQRVTARWTPETALQEKTTYLWCSRAITTDLTGEWTAMRSFAVGVLPRVYRLDQNFPNPFNPETKIMFSLAEEGDVTLEIINIIGQRIRVLIDEYKAPGDYQAIWDGNDSEGRPAASGIYFYRLHSGAFTETRKMALLR